MLVPELLTLMEQNKLSKNTYIKEITLRTKWDFIPLENSWITQYKAL